MKGLRNCEVRQAAKDAGIKLWEIAEVLGCADATLSRKLRRELPDDDRDRILGIIHQLDLESRGAR